MAAICKEYPTRLAEPKLPITGRYPFPNLFQIIFFHIQEVYLVTSVFPNKLRSDCSKEGKLHGIIPYQYFLRYG